MPIEKYTATINPGKVRNPEKITAFVNNNGTPGSGVNEALEIQKIRNVVMIVLGIHGFISLLSLISSLLIGDGVATSLIRTLLTAALLYQVLQAKNWARWVLVVLTILGALVLMVGSLGVFALGGTGIGVFLLLIAVGFIACAIALIVPPASKYFDAR
jgi:hypothetical protein